MHLYRTAELIQAGVDEHSLRGPRFTRLMHGIYVPGQVSVTLPLLLDASRLVLGADITATGMTGLQLHGVGDGPLVPLTVIASRRSRRRELNVIPRKPGMPTGFVAPPIDCLHHVRLPLAQKIGVIDEMLHRGVIDLRDLNVPGLDRFVSLVHPLAESRRESELRSILIFAGLPEPKVQWRIFDRDGVFVARVDLAWPELRVVCEYEGQQHATDMHQWSRDIERYRNLEALGWTTIRVNAAMLRSPAKVVAIVYQALLAHGYRGHAPRCDGPWHAKAG